MSLINWTSKLSVGSMQLDADHIILIGLINQLYDAMSEGHGEELVETILSTMKEYTVSHFRNEERLMREHKYPNYEDHKIHHADLIERLNAFMAKYAQDAASVTTPEISQFLQGWLVNHIKKEDFGYKPYVRGEALTC